MRRYLKYYLVIFILQFELLSFASFQCPPSAIEVKNKEGKLCYCTLVKSVGEGSFGKCYLYKDSNCSGVKNNWVLKILSDTADYKQQKTMNLEADILTALSNSENFLETAQIINYFGNSNFLKRNYFPIVTKYCEYGNLINFDNKQRPNNDLIIKIFIQTLKQLSQMHEQGIIHKDIKPDNILIDKNFNSKITDYGLSCTEHCHSLIKSCGSPPYAAPEAYKLKHVQKSDVFSLAMSFWYMLYKEFPTQKINQIMKYRNINTKYYSIIVYFKENYYKDYNKIVFNSDCKLSNILLKMLHPNPKLRINSKKALDEVSSLIK